MDVIRTALAADNILSPPMLQTLGRQVLRDVLSEPTTKLLLEDLRRLWIKLQRTACSYRVVDQYLSAACNAVCVFLRYTKNNQDEKVRSLAYSKEIWVEGFDVVHKAFNCGKLKPALQVLDILLQILYDDPDQDSAKLTAYLAISEMVSIVVTAQPEIRLKEACIVLSCFLRRLPELVKLSTYCTGLDQRAKISFIQRCQNRQISTIVCRPGEQTASLDVLFLALLLNIDVSESRTAALKLFSYACSKGEKHDYLENIPRASHMIQVYLTANTKSLADFSIDVFPAVLDTSVQFEAYLQQYTPAQEPNTFELEIYLVILEVGRRQGYLNEHEVANHLNSIALRNEETDRHVLAGWVGFHTLLAHQKPVLRLRTYSLLTISHETNRPVDGHLLKCLQESFRSLHDDSDAYYRDLFVSISRRLLNRIARSAQTARKEQQSGGQHTLAVSTTEQYQEFLDAYLRFLILELGPHVSYSRHSLGLQMIERMIEYGLLVDLCNNNTHITLNLTDSLLSLVLDPFEDVRAMSSRILITLIRQKYHLVSKEFTAKEMLRRVSKLSARTNRGDHADALGRLYLLHSMIVLQHSKCTEEILPQTTFRNALEGPVKELELHLASNTYLRPATSFALHGTLLGIAYSLNEPEVVASSMSTDLGWDIVSMCTNVWHRVQEELCIDSPERATENDEQDGLTGPKDLLAYSWRALRDSSLILQALLNVSSAFTVPLLKAVGQLCFEQLKMLRHRGAFSTVAQTFVLCCQVIRSCKDDGLNSELLEWQYSAMHEINHQSATLTRRSAGLPAMFAALSDPNDPTSFILMIEKLENIAEIQPVSPSNDTVESAERLPQVHALNCIKELMVNSRFRTVTEPLVVPILNLAAKSLGSDIWAIRNSGLMLFRACIGRFTPETTMASAADSRTIPQFGNLTPLALATKLLRERQNDELQHSQRPEIVFAALDLLGRIPVDVATVVEVNQLLEQQFGNSLWSIREYAARLRTLTTRSGQETSAFRSILRLYSTLNPNSKLSSYGLHGRLLCGRLTLQQCRLAAEHSRGHDTTNGLISSLYSQLRTHLEKGYNAYVIAAFLDILNDAYAANLKQNGDCTKIEQFSELILAVYQSGNQNHSHYLLHRAVQLNAVYQMFWTKSNVESNNNRNRQVCHDNLSSYHDTADADVMLYILEQLAELPALLLAPWLADLYIEIISSSNNDEVCAAATQGLFDHFQLSLKGLTESQLKSLLNIFVFRISSTREFCNSQIALATLLIPEIIRTSWNQSSDLIVQVVNSLQQSLLDDIEVPTRMNALKLIGFIQPYLLRGGQCGLAFSEPDRVRVLLMLYDCLNDDDEDVREVANDVASAMIVTGVQRATNLPVCTVTTRELLLQLLFDNFSDSTMLMARACGKIIGAAVVLTPNETQSISNHCQINTVTSTIQVAARTASELFAEEKQNLYIDEVLELRAWARQLAKCRIEILTERSLDAINIISNMCSWTIDGVRELNSLLSGSPAVDDVFGPMGPSYNEDILIIFMRVLTTAQVLLHHDYEARKAVSSRKAKVDFGSDKEIDDLVHELRTLQVTCRQNGAHDLVLESITAALEGR